MKTRNCIFIVYNGVINSGLIESRQTNLYISSIKIENYKSYRSSSEIALGHGFNIVTGQNNVGKTALLEALSLRFSNHPHRSVSTVPRPGTPVDHASKVKVVIRASRDEVLNLLPLSPRPNRIPLPMNNSPMERPSDFFLQNVFGKNSLAFSFEFGIDTLVATTRPSFGVYTVEPGSTVASEFVKTPGEAGVTTVHGGANYGTIAPELTDFGYFIASCFQTSVYAFKAERFNRGRCTIGPNSILAPDASNLAEVLSNLSNNRNLYTQYLNKVRQILPQVKQVTVANRGESIVEILVWTDDEHSTREDLAFSLNESGTGIGQVLAIIYVLFTSQDPRTILIDEPQSFLHPGAVRKLIEVLKEYPQHQYILATHSPTVISSSNPSTITLVKQSGSESTLQTIDPKENEQLRDYLDEIGARLSDVFGADEVLWVEGPTEERCFPLIFEQFADRPLMGRAIIGVKETGDLEGPHKADVFEIYRRLTSAAGLLPPAIGFIFDNEGRSEKDQEDIKRQSRGKVTFLKRRLFENYLLSPKAITTLVNSIEGFRETPFEVSEIEAWISEHKNQRDYIHLPTEDEHDWLERGHGAKLLADLFTKLSEAKVVYKKVEHSKWLTAWLLKNQPSALEEIAELLYAKVPQAGTDTQA